MKLRFSLLALAALATCSAHAGLVTWGPAQTITGDSDVSTDGSLVGAFNMGFVGVTTTTVNGVPFAHFALSGLPDSNGNFSFTGTSFGGNNVLGFGAAPFVSLSAPYQALLGSAVITNGTAGANFTLTMNGLSVGTNYAFQWWSSSSQSFTGFGTTTATSGASIMSLDKNTTDVGGGVGQWAIGTFTADSASQSITFASTATPVLNGFQLRQLPPPIPEPGTALFGLALSGTTLLRRRR